jgi:hypothetical protein
MNRRSVDKKSLLSRMDCCKEALSHEISHAPISPPAQTHFCNTEMTLLRICVFFNAGCCLLLLSTSSLIALSIIVVISSICRSRPRSSLYDRDVSVQVGAARSCGLTSSFFRDLFRFPALPIASILASSALFRAVDHSKIKLDTTCKCQHANKLTKGLIILIRLLQPLLLLLIPLCLPIIALPVDIPRIVLVLRI